MVRLLPFFRSNWTLPFLPDIVYPTRVGRDSHCVLGVGREGTCVCRRAVGSSLPPAVLLVLSPDTSGPVVLKAQIETQPLCFHHLSDTALHHVIFII